MKQKSSLREPSNKEQTFNIKKADYLIASNIYGSYCVPLSSSYTYTSQSIIAGKIHEPSTIKYIMDNCGSDDIIHAGAGFGDFLPAISKRCRSKVWTFEPNEENYACAKKTIQLNELKNVNLSKNGLGREPKQTLLMIEKNNKSLGPRCEIFEGKSKHSANKYKEIELVRLDDVIPESSKISVIHLDVEGYEEAVLDGAKRIIKKDNPIIILEIHTEAVKYNDYMHAIGYIPFKQLIFDAGPMVFVNTVYKNRQSAKPPRS